VVTHLYGNVADVEPIRRLCDERGVLLVEDCAQAIGARRDGRFAGTFGHLAAFSFYPTKNLGALGDGGAVVTDDPALAASVRALRQYGWEHKYHVVRRHGRNSRLDELQAAILRSKLPMVDRWNERRRTIVGRYAGALDVSAGRFVFDEGTSVAHLAVALVEDRDRARAVLEERGIGTDVHYPVADHRQPVWDGHAVQARLPVTEDAVEHVLTVPCFPELEDAEIDHVCEALDDL
jgi:dTDP-4-amino-4,6-dideoxygalactose transaminase